MAVTVKAERCKGCHYCIETCPKKAISLAGAMNKQGYEYVQVDEEKCISCGLCFAVCPDLVFEIS